MRSRAPGGPNEATGALNQVRLAAAPILPEGLRRGQSGQSRPGLPAASNFAGAAGLARAPAIGASSG